MRHQELQAPFPLRRVLRDRDRSRADHALVLHAPAAAVPRRHELVIDVDAEADPRVPANDVELASLVGTVEIEDREIRFPGESVIERDKVRLRAVRQGEMTGVGPLEDVE